MKMELRKVTRDEWVAALRSGDYKQGDKVLCNSRGNAFCCLGVLGRLAGMPKARLKGQPWTKAIADLYDTLLPDDGGEPLQTFATMNDQGYPFSDIAAEIERLLPAKPAQ
jgi:hypothetical protein